MENILQNATIILKNGQKQLSDAAVITDKGIYIGVISKKNDGTDEFEEHSFVPNDQIEKISFINKEGKQIEIDF
ncbi:MAG: hypothetical protein JSU91_00390 [Thermoplasmatales archaeon]|nr:MAG: hypothetical protein JSU91_00390 [Thermoplasmatales archaeon]